MLRGRTITPKRPGKITILRLHPPFLQPPPMHAQLSTPFPFSSLNLGGYSAICGALSPSPSPSLPLSPIRPVIRYDVRRSRMARSAHSLSPSAFLESHAVSPSRRERGRPHPPEIPPRLRVPHLPFSSLCPRVKHFSQRERLSSRQVSLSHSGLAFRSLALCPRSEDAIHVYTKCAPRAMGGGKDGRADDGRRDDGTDVEEGEER